MIMFFKFGRVQSKTFISNSQLHKTELWLVGGLSFSIVLCVEMYSSTEKLCSHQQAALDTHQFNSQKHFKQHVSHYSI